MPMVLDDPREITRIDASGMLGMIRRLGPMIVEGWDAAAPIPLPARPPDAVLVCGMGGSAIGGDLLRVLLFPTASIPVLNLRDDRLPAFVGARTLVFLCSYSGNTEETLVAYEAATAARAHIVVVTSGGEIAARARQRGHPIAPVPGGLQPRAALPFLLMPMLRVAAGLDLAPAPDADVREASGLLTDLAARWGPDQTSAGNPAKRLAEALSGTLPLIFAASPFMEPVARRWKTQFNENAKTHALFDGFPELVHNEVVAWERDDSPAMHVVILRDQDDGPRNLLRVEAARDLLFGRARGVTEVWTQGAGRLARLFSLILFGDLVSGYLAILSGVDPTPVEAIARIKDRLRSG